MASALLSLSCLAIDHKLTVTTGLFGTDQTSKDGWVTPWRLYYTSTYKNDHAKEWAAILGGGNFDIIEEVDEATPEAVYTQEPD